MALRINNTASSAKRIKIIYNPEGLDLGPTLRVKKGTFLNWVDSAPPSGHSCGHLAGLRSGRFGILLIVYKGLLLWENGHATTAVSYALLTFVGCLLAVWGSVHWARSVF